MARSPSFPLLFDRDAERLTIEDVAWQIFEDTETVDVLQAVNFREETVVYEVTSVPKPFGGVQWYLVCPITKKRARILYRFNLEHSGLYAHRSAFKNACYSIQTESKSDRNFTSMRKAESKLQRAAIRRHSKVKYRGRLTQHFDSAKRRYEILAKRVQVHNSLVLNREAKIPACLRRRFDRYL